MVNSSIPNSNPATGRISTPSLSKLKRADFLQCGRRPPWRAVALGEGGSAAICCEFALVGRWALDVERWAFSFSEHPRWVARLSLCVPFSERLFLTTAVESWTPCSRKLAELTLFNAQRSALNTQRSIQTVGRWMPCSRTLSELDVECLPRRSARAKAGWIFSSFRRSWTSTLFNAQRSTFNAQRSILIVGRWALGVESWAFSPIRRVRGAWWPSRSSKPLLIPHTRDQGRFDSYPLRLFIHGAWASSPCFIGKMPMPQSKGGERMSREQIRKLTSLSSCAG
jgi:hypothetical protein